MSNLFVKLHRDMNHVYMLAIHRCINEGYGLIQIFTEKIRISPTKLWRVWVLSKTAQGVMGGEENEQMGVGYGGPLGTCAILLAQPSNPSSYGR